MDPNSSHPPVKNPQGADNSNGMEDLGLQSTRLESVAEDKNEPQEFQDESVFGMFKDDSSGDETETESDTATSGIRAPPRSRTRKRHKSQSRLRSPMPTSSKSLDPTLPNEEEDENPLFPASLSHNTRRPASISSVETTDLMDHRMHQQPRASISARPDSTENSQTTSSISVPGTWGDAHRSFPQPFMQRRKSLSKSSTFPAASAPNLSPIMSHTFEKGKGNRPTSAQVFGHPGQSSREGTTAPLLNRASYSQNYNSFPTVSNDLSTSPQHERFGVDDADPLSTDRSEYEYLNMGHRPSTIAEFLHRQSFSVSMDGSEPFGSEPASRRHSAASSLLDVCLPIDAQGNVSRAESGHENFDMSYLDEFAQNERRELHALQESLSEEAAQNINHPASVDALRTHTVNEVNNLEGTRLRPYRVVPWKNGQPQPGSTFEGIPDVGSNRLADSASGGRFASRAGAKNRKNGKQFDPFFTGVPHHHHSGPPLRFTYFREDLDSTVHSPSISGLLQDDQTFDDLFNLFPATSASASASVMHSAVPTNGMQTPEIGTLTPQVTATAGNGPSFGAGGGTNTPITTGPNLPPSAIAAHIAKQAITVERSLSRVSSPLSSTVQNHQQLPHSATSSAPPPSTQPTSRNFTSPTDRNVSSTNIIDAYTSSTPSPGLIPATAGATTTAHVLQLPNASNSSNATVNGQNGSNVNNGRYDPSPFWLDVMNPTEDEMKAISKAFGIHPLTTEDIMLNEPREKVELFRNYYLVCFRSFDINDEKSKMRASISAAEERSLKHGRRKKMFNNDGEDSSSEEYGLDTVSSKRSKGFKVNAANKLKHGKSRRSKDSELTPLNMYMVVFHEGVLTFHFSPTPHPMNVRRRIRLLRDYIALSSDWISYALIDDITDGFAPMIEAIEEEVNCIEDEILSMHTDWSDSSSTSESESDSDSDASYVISEVDSRRSTGSEKLRKKRMKTSKYANSPKSTIDEEETVGMKQRQRDPSTSSRYNEAATDTIRGLASGAGAGEAFAAAKREDVRRSETRSKNKNRTKSSTKLSSMNSRINSTRWARGSTVDAPVGGILGNAKNAASYTSTILSSDESEDSIDGEQDVINDYTQTNPRFLSSNRRKYGLRGITNFDELREHGVPGELNNHVIIDESDSEDDDAESYHDDRHSRKSLLPKNRKGSSYAHSIRSSKTHKSTKSQKSNSSKRSHRSRRSNATGTSWSSTASGRWKEKGDMLRRIGECRKRIMSVLRLLGSKADVIKGFSKRCNEQWEVAPRYEIGLYLGDIQDHIVTMVQSLNHYEKLLARSHSNYLAQINIDMTRVNNEMNDVLSKITVLGTIVLPMNIVTGLWGMNVLVPGQDVQSLSWFWSITGMLFIFGCISFMIARRVYGIA